MTRNRVVQGDALEVLRTLPDAFVHCCVTSPPYYGLRDYGVEGQIGLEETPDAYVAKLVEVFREVQRVLRPDGTLWLNLGDSYARGRTGRADGGRMQDDPESWRDSMPREHVDRGIPQGLKDKDLVGIPWMAAFALRSDGWYLRSDIIWNKPNAMPEPVSDRPTHGHEYLFLLTRSTKYFYDADAIREPHADDWYARACTWRNGEAKRQQQDPLYHGYTNGAPFQNPPNPLGRNKRTVWTINPKPYKGAHFAVFPETLPETCIKAGTSERGCCPSCGKPWVRVAEDWRADCSCPAQEPAPCIVLDPFAGSGTALAVASALRRDYIGIELNPEYIALIEERLRPANETRSQQNTFDMFMRDGEG